VQGTIICAGCRPLFIGHGKRGVVIVLSFLKKNVVRL
jgi:hypothetical protein